MNEQEAKEKWLSERKTPTGRQTDGETVRERWRPEQALGINI